MKFELNRDHSLGRNLQRLCRKQVDKALAIARGECVSKDPPVHETRKCLKKARAALRLGSAALGQKRFKRCDQLLRDVGRLISEMRDAEVRLQTVREVQGITARRADRSFRQTESLLQDELAHFVAAFAGWQAQAAAQLESVCLEMASWSVDDIDCRSVRTAAQHAYKCARDAMDRARKDHTAEKFHDFRSETKRLLYQLRILRPINPVVMRAISDDVSTLGSVLGRAHDLFFLGERLRTKPAPPPPREARELVTVLECGEAELQNRALELAEHCFKQRPRDFGRQIDSWLETWCRNEAGSVADTLACGDPLR